MSSDNASSIYALPDTTVQLVVNVLGSPTPDIVWFRDHTLITDQDQNLILSANHKQLTIRNIGTQYYAIYQCYVRNTAGVDSYNFTIQRAGKSVKLHDY